LRWVRQNVTLPRARADRRAAAKRTKPMRQLLLIVGFLALAVGLLWIGQAPAW
jgi:hypothetical protein